MPGTQPGAARPKKPAAGKVPAWALKLGTVLATFSVFAGCFGFASTHLYATNAPLQPATVAAVATTSSNTTATATKTAATTTLTSTVRTTTRTAVTATKHS